MSTNTPYRPAEDTWLLEDSLRNIRDVNRSVEVGCGTGYITKILSEKSRDVIAIEKDIQSAYDARDYLKDVLGNIHIIIADGMSPINDYAKIDLIVSNPPYLPSDETLHDQTIHGGPTGVETSEEIIKQALPFLRRGGELFLISSSLGDQEKLLETIHQFGLSAEILNSRRMFFEEIICLKIYQAQK
ncbi:MAG: methyltransferase [Nitrososphaerota archaeon]